MQNFVCWNFCVYGNQTCRSQYFSSLDQISPILQSSSEHLYKQMRWEYEVVRSSVRQRYGYNVVKIIAGCDSRVWAFHNCRFSFLCEICMLALDKSKAVEKSAHCILQRVRRGYNSQYWAVCFQIFLETKSGVRTCQYI